MKKPILYISYCWLTAALLFAGCKKDKSDTPADLSVSPAAAFPETPLTIRGRDMQDIVSIKFDTTRAGFSSVFNTGEVILTSVPANARFGEQVITLTNRAGKTAEVSFTVMQPAPVIRSFTPANAPEGDTITISGILLTRIQSVLIGSTPAIIVDSSSRTQLKVKIPIGASSGLISVVTAGGSAKSASVFSVGERSVLIADFEGAGQRPNGNSWYSYGDINTKTVTNANPAPKNGTGSFLKVFPNTPSSNSLAGFSTYASGSGNETFGLTSTTAATTLKFDVNNNGKTGTVVQVIVQESTTDNNSTNFAKTVTINGTGWNTVSIPLTQLFNNYGGGTLTPTPANITRVKFHFQGFGSTAMEANIDNVRFAY